MRELKFSTDRMVDSTDNNEFATGIRDEALWAEEIVTQVPLDEQIPDAVNENGEEDRPLYDEKGMMEDDDLPRW